MTAIELAAKGHEALSKIESIRIRSGRLQGKLSGDMRKVTEITGEIITALLKKIMTKGNMEHFKMDYVR